MLNRRAFLRGSLLWPFSASLLSPLTALPAENEHSKAQRDETLTKGRPTEVESLSNAVVMKKDGLFLVARPDGAVPMTGNHGMGLYYHDCRYLNGYELTLADQAAAPLSASAAQGSIGVFALTNPEIRLSDGRTLAKEELGVTWQRMLDSERPALLDTFLVHNFTTDAVKLTLTLVFRSAFEDIYNVRGLVKKQYGRLHAPRWKDHRLYLGYDGLDGVTRTLSIHADPQPDEHRDTAASFHLDIPPSGQRALHLSLAIYESKAPAQNQPAVSRANSAQVQAELEEQVQAWMGDVTQVSGDGSALDQLMHRSLRSLRVLRTPLGPHTYFAAGVPWFVTLFGRDSLITALQMLAYHPGIAEQTLHLLARYQGTDENDWRDEQPGKILHELRIGELANLNVIPHTPFYGTVDATPLFLIALARHAEWTGSLRLFDDLRSHVASALQWLRTSSSGSGYLAYESRTDQPTQMVNKGWKDSGDAIVNADGSLATPPIALVEVQGYVYAAFHGMANLFERSGDRSQADTLRQEAQQLRSRFNRDFWMEDHGCYALALQQDGRPAAVISSNPGHALWAGIADEEKAQRTIDRLTADDMFSGWGVRTLSKKATAFNPIGYHLGTVWPHDNSMLAAVPSV